MLPPLSTGCSSGRTTHSHVRQTTDASALLSLVCSSSPVQLEHIQTHIIPNKTVHAPKFPFSATTPANTAPKTPPTGGDAAKSPINTFIALPGGTMSMIVATELGMKTPPPMPVRARKAMKDA